jgi:ribosomal protein S18 acetylase RimI-like enzyme
MGTATATEVRVRAAKKSDAAALATIDAHHSGGSPKRSWWDDVIARHLKAPKAGGGRVGLVAVEGPKDRVVGFVFGQVRAFEFGSDPCGWIYAVGVHPDCLRKGVAAALARTALKAFKDLGAPVVRTMVRADDVPVLTFFRSQGFAAGPYVELELPLGEAPR